VCRDGPAKWGYQAATITCNHSILVVPRLVAEQRVVAGLEIHGELACLAWREVGDLSQVATRFSITRVVLGVRTEVLGTGIARR